MRGVAARELKPNEHTMNKTRKKVFRIEMRRIVRFATKMAIPWKPSTSSPAWHQVQSALVCGCAYSICDRGNSCSSLTMTAVRFVKNIAVSLNVQAPVYCRKQPRTNGVLTAQIRKTKGEWI